jgi:hypothetical protein
MKRAAAALGALLVACAAWAQGDTVQRGAAALESLEERIKASARPIAGSDTRYLIAGYLQLDGLWTRRELTGDEKDTFLSSAIPFGAADSDTRLSVRASQFNALTHTPTRWGDLIGHVQADLFAYDEGAEPNLTQLALHWGEWLKLGKTYTTFMDDAAWPSTLDYNGPSGAVFVRQVLIRGSVPLAGGLRLEAALEDPQADESAGGPNFSASASSERPDVVARLRYEGERLHAQLAGLSRSVTYSAQLASLASVRRTITGTGVNASFALQVGDDDRLLGQWNQGEGVGRYYNDGLSDFGAVYDAGGTLEPLKLSGYYLYYERKWAERWTTTAGVSELRAKSEGLRPAADLRRVRYLSANLVNRLRTNLYLGAELLWGEAERMDYTQADDTRVQVTARYYLY